MRWALVSSSDSLDPEHSSAGEVANPGHTGHYQLDFQIKSLILLRGFLFQGLQLSKIALVQFCAAQIPGQFPQFADNSPHWL